MTYFSARERLQSLFPGKIATAAHTQAKSVQFIRSTVCTMEEPDGEESPRDVRDRVPSDCDDTFYDFERRETASWPSAAKDFNALAAIPEVRRGRQSPVTSFGSVGENGRAAVGSFDSTVTDFDYLTCPGAQAEMNAEYCAGLCQAPPRMLGDPDLTTLRSAVIPAFKLPQNPNVGGPVSAIDQPTLLHDSATAGLQAQAAQYEFMAAQIMAQAYQAKARALRMQGDVSAEAQMVSHPVLLGPPPPSISVGPWAQPSSVPQVSLNAQQSPEQVRGKSQKASAQTSAGKADGDRTTLMLRNLPNDLTRDMLLELLDRQGFAGCFDFIYLPMDMRRKAGLGYCFVNMVTPAEAERAFEVLQGFSEWKLFGSTKVLELAWGDPLQGLEAHVNRYRNSPVMHADAPVDFRPLLFKNGRQVEFPPPTRKLRAPRLDFRGH